MNMKNFLLIILLHILIIYSCNYKKSKTISTVQEINSDSLELNCYVPSYEHYFSIKNCDSENENDDFCNCKIGLKKIFDFHSETLDIEKNKFNELITFLKKQNEKGLFFEITLIDFHTCEDLDLSYKPHSMLYLLHLEEKTKLLNQILMNEKISGANPLYSKKIVSKKGQQEWNKTNGININCEIESLVVLKLLDQSNCLDR